MAHYQNSASFYDRIYADKDYRGEVEGLCQALRDRGLQGGHCLDLACGSGRHLEFLQVHFDCQGLDLEAGLLEQATQRLGKLPLHQADMLDFSLAGQSFDLITCFFGSVGYLKETDRLCQAVQNWAHHLKPGGWLALERWLDPSQFQPGRVFANFVDEPDFKLARMVVSAAQGTLYDSEFHYLVATPAGVEHRVERHQLRMFTASDYEQALHGAGLAGSLVEEAGMRGMYLARKPPPEESADC